MVANHPFDVNPQIKNFSNLIVIIHSPSTQATDRLLRIRRSYAAYVCEGAAIAGGDYIAATDMPPNAVRGRYLRGSRHRRRRFYCGDRPAAERSEGALLFRNLLSGSHVPEVPSKFHRIRT